MPFAITCPACRHTFRTAKEREIGKGVQCAKCSNQFYISAENQEEVRESKSGPPPVPKPMPRKRERSRAQDEELDGAYDREEDTPRKAKPKKRARKGLLILGLLGFVMVAVAGGGAYFFFFRSGAAGVEPKKELPLELFIYAPAERSIISYYDLAVLREKNAVPASLTTRFADRLPIGSGITPGEVDAYCESSARVKEDLYSVTAIRLSTPRMVEDVAKKCQFTSLDIGGTKIYQGPHKKGQAAIFQTAPNRLIFVSSYSQKELDKSILSDLVQRSTSKFSLAADIMECLTEVSGYPVISVGDVGNNVAGVWRVQAEGKTIGGENELKELRIRSYDSEADASNKMKQNRGKIPVKGAKGYNTWLKGRMTFELMISDGSLT